MNCTVYTDGTCGPAGQNWYVRNNSRTTAYTPTIEALRDGAAWGWRDPGEVAPGRSVPLNLCSYDSGHYYRCVVRGEVQS